MPHLLSAGSPAASAFVDAAQRGPGSVACAGTTWYWVDGPLDVQQARQVVKGCHDRQRDVACLLAVMKGQQTSSETQLALTEPLIPLQDAQTEIDYACVSLADVERLLGQLGPLIEANVCLVQSPLAYRNLEIMTANLEILFVALALSYTAQRSVA
ncbi:unnamed protein product [Vitrella brassicaformis CCMP3155]|uniref:Uncharacterized protein n=2 Tax=Vitrella brassicaformis TaxID=1169539 RepID=A0A0G4EHS0_VITBC|nr:unnamed protein product [Vitrella brassicaformis CCMP3155]|eukprot:CEL96233.1 unnamed protein product [Vitrella brassicaformis CCMP3155]